MLGTRLFCCTALLVWGAVAAPAGLLEFDFDIDVTQAVPEPTIPGGAPIPFGSGLVTYNPDTNEIDWLIEYENLTGEIVSPGAHLHGPAGFGETAGIQVTLTDGDPPEPATGSLAGSSVISEDQEMQLLDGLWYVNIHTELNPAGEIRGQVIPEPSSLALLALAGLPLLRRR